MGQVALAMTKRFVINLLPKNFEIDLKMSLGSYRLVIVRKDTK